MIARGPEIMVGAVALKLVESTAVRCSRRRDD